MTRAFIALFLIAIVIAVGCGGGSDTTVSNPVAVFTPDSGLPGPGTVALLGGTVAGAAVNVRVTVTGVPSFFGAAFRIKYDPTALLFNGMTDSASFLRNGVTASDVFFLADSSSVSGEVIITATRIDPTVAPPVDVTTTSDLLIVNFVARKAIATAAAEGRLELSDPRQVCDGSTAPPGCGAVAVAWTGGGISAQ